MGTKDSLRWTVSALLGMQCALALAAGQAPANARSEAFTLDIPAQQLDEALQALALMSKHELLYSSKLLEGMRSPSLKGTYTAEQAVQQLLSGMNLMYQVTADRLIVIRPPGYTPISATWTDSQAGANSSNGNGHRLRLAQLTEVDSTKPSSALTSQTVATDAGEETLQEVLVQAARFYQATDSSMAAKIDMPLLETPQAVSVITEDLIDTFGITDLKWVSKYVSGLDSRVTVVGQSSDFTARGFTLDLEDGFKMNGFQYIPVQPIDTVAVERVEFLKGPTGILYGRNDYGGMLNYITKQPENRHFTNVSVSAGAGDVELKRVQADINTTLVDDVLMLRLPVAYEVHDNYHDNDSRQFSAVPTLRWQVSEDTRVTLGAVIQSWNSNRQIGVSPRAIGTSAEDVNWQTGNGRKCREASITCVEPPSHLKDVLLSSDADYYDTSTLQTNAKFETRLTDHLNFFAAANHHESEVLSQQHYVGTAISEDGFAYMSRDAQAYLRDSDGVETGVTGEFGLFGRVHKFYVGGDYRRYQQDYYDNWDEILSDQAINVFALRGRNAFRDWLDATGEGQDRVPYQAMLQREKRDWGLGMQVAFELAEPLTLLVGGRYERSRFQDRYFQLEQNCLRTSCRSVGDFDGAYDREGAGNVFLPRAGLTWKLVPERWTIYASYTEGFIPQTGVTRSGGGIEPETGYQLEVGLKGQLFDDRFMATLAWWQIDREGVAVADPNNVPGEIFVVGGLGQRNRGVEFEAVGQLLPELNVVVAASVTDGSFGKSTNVFYSGKEITSTPDYKVSAYLNYEFLGDVLRGFSLGSGFTAVGEQWGVFPAAFRVDSYVTVDLKVGYAFDERKRLSVQVQNLLDENYFMGWGSTWEGCCGAFGEGRSVRVTFDVNL